MGKERVEGVVWKAGQKVSLQARVTGETVTQVQAKVWAWGSKQPSAWQITSTDQASVKNAGVVGVSGTGGRYVFHTFQAIPVK